MLKIGVFLCLGTLIAFAQPTINPGGVLNAASYALPGLPNANIAQGSIFTIFGSNLGPETGVSATSFPLPTTQGLAGTSIEVRVDFPPQSFFVPMLYTSAGQVIAIMPSAVPTGKATTISVTYQGVQSTPIPIIIVQSRFGVFSTTASGTGPGAIQNFIPDAQWPINSLYAPAQPGQAVILWGTGLGPVTGDETQPPVVGDHPEFEVQVYVGGKEAEVDYRGRAGCCSGLDQINIRLPDDVPLGCYVPVVVLVGGIASNTTTMSISANGARCSDPVSFADADLTALEQSHGTTRIGSVVLERQQSDSGIVDTGMGWFGTYSYNQIVLSRGLYGVPSLGGCTVYQFKGAQPTVTDAVQPTLLDGGMAIYLTAFGGQRQLLGRSGIYSDRVGGGGLSPFLEPGVFGINNGNGGPNVLPFSANLTIPAAPAWLFPVTTVPRSQDLTVSWSAGDPGTEYARITGYSVSNDVGAVFFCSAPAGPAPAYFTIPSYILSALPAGTGTLAVGISSQPAAHRLVLPTSGLNALYLGYRLMNVRNVVYGQ